MTQRELYESLRQTEEENKAKVRELLRAKANGIKADTDTTMTYSQAKKAGNVSNMLAHRLGIVEAQKLEQELEKVMQTPITEVIAELKEIDSKISEHEEKMNATIQRLKEQYQQEFINETKGLRAGDSRYDVALTTRNKKISAISSIDEVKTLSNSINTLNDRRPMLAKAKANYINTNKEIIEEARRAKIMAEINASGLLADID